MNREIEQYRKYLFQKHSETITVTTYLTEITSFCDFIVASKPECQYWSEVTLENARDFCHKLSSRGKKGITINHYISSLRLFYDYLMILDKAQKNPFRHVNFYKVSWGVPAVLDDKQSARLVGAPMREYQILIDALDGPKPRRRGRLIYLRALIMGTPYLLMSGQKRKNQKKRKNVKNWQ